MDAATGVAIDGQQMFGMIAALLWTALRIGGLLMAMPLIGTRAVPARVRVMVTLALSLALAPLLPTPPAWSGFDAATVLSVARELAIGAAMGFLLKLVFEAGALAGELISQGTGLSFAQMSDPMRGVQSGVIAQWFYIAFGLLFFAANGHLALIALLVRSYEALPIGTALPDLEATLQIVPSFFVVVLRGAVSLALPVMVAMLAINLAFGVLSRAAPALFPVQVGLPVSVLVGLFLIAVLAGELGPPVQRLYDAAFDAAARLPLGQ
ncbi:MULTISPECIES: flagellar biosynthetic protein FliR [Luteimonas]|uniref:flagellar biosynthetic protein FliR n=1 Tax=Luteimonas TaxID=83614 RepID=UPI000C7D4C7C|nr:MULTISPECIES: flagellar biosynthetic protein FliR [Luteimonas]